MPQQPPGGGLPMCPPAGGGMLLMPPTMPPQDVPTCQRQGCTFPTWDQKPGYCSKACKAFDQQAGKFQAPPPAGPMCVRCGSFPTFNGQPGGYCSRKCQSAAKQQPPGGGGAFGAGGAAAPFPLPGGQAGGPPICQRPHCGKPTYDGRPGYCSKGCRDIMRPASAAAPPGAPRGGGQGGPPMRPPPAGAAAGGAMCAYCRRKPASGLSQFCSMECNEASGG
mmetsp:Transcript_17400/g.31357  ORF Transcript_17400/g.31357 Transcript_17400/m.31357 type:complete len:221 (-) Transcript_17400:38-700(-)